MQRDENGRFRTLTAAERLDAALLRAEGLTERAVLLAETGDRGAGRALWRARAALDDLDAAIADAETEVERLRGAAP